MHNIDLKLLPDSISPRNHLDDTINQTLDFFFRHNSDESSYMSWVAIPAMPGQSIYKVPHWVEGIIETYSSFNGMLANPFMMLDVGSMESFVSMSLNYSDWNLAGYTAAKMNMAEIQRSVGANYYSKLVFNEKGEKELHISPPPPHYDSMSGGRMLVSRVYRRAPLGQIFGHPLFVEIATARLKEVWGMILNLYNRPLPGGGSVNGEFIYNMGVKDREKYEAQLIGESSQPMMGFY